MANLLCESLRKFCETKKLSKIWNLEILNVFCSSLNVTLSEVEGFLTIKVFDFAQTDTRNTTSLTYFNFPFFKFEYFRSYATEMHREFSRRHTEFFLPRIHEFLQTHKASKKVTNKKS